MRAPFASAVLRLGPGLALAACTSEAEVARVLEGALLDANDALAAALVSAEPRSWALAPPSDALRHATACGCPCRIRTGEPPTFVLALDYHTEGCIPDSGLVAGGVAGIVTVEVDGDAVTVWPEGGRVAEAPLRGRLSGDATRATGTLGVGARDFELDVDVATGAAVTLDGEVVVDGVPVALRGVEIARPDLAGDCPSPSAGRAVVAGPDGEVEVAFGRPGNGRVVATWGRHGSAPTELCGFRSALF